MEIKKGEKIEKYNNFQNIGNETRKIITFVNTTIQSLKDIGHGNSFLKNFLCNKDEQKLYGTFKLNSIDFKERKEYELNDTLYDFLKNIFDEFYELMYTYYSVFFEIQRLG